MKKINLTINVAEICKYLGLVLSVLILLKAPTVSADTLNVNCASGRCQETTATRIFSQSNFRPGNDVTNSIQVQNMDSEPCQLSLNLQNDYQTIQDYFDVVIYEAQNPVIQPQYGLYSGSLANLRDNQVDLGSIPAHSTQFYQWQLAASPRMDNRFQNQTLEFDFDLNFVCEEEAVEDNQDPNSDPDSGSSNDFQNHCSAQEPQGSPNLSAQIVEDMVLLRWSQVSPVTHYALEYWDSAGNRYGASNIGNVNQYFVKDLYANTTYTFQIIPVNDCMPGDRSNEVEVRVLASGDIQITQGSVQGAFFPDSSNSQSIVSVESNQNDLSAEEKTVSTDDQLIAGQNQTESRQGQVLGSQSTCNFATIYLPLILLLLQLLMHVLFEHMWLDITKLTKTYAMILIPGLINVVFYLLRDCSCSVSMSLIYLLCQWFILFSLLLFAVIRLYYYLFVEEKQMEETL